MPRSLLLLDAPSLWFRAFYGAPLSVTAPDGTPVNAVRGFLDYVSRHLRERRPDDFVAAVDVDWRPAWRVELVPDYKLHRVAQDGGDGTPDPLSPQVQIILDVLAAAGLCVAGAADYEADDVIGTLCSRAGGPVDVVTGDRDLFQLVRDQPHRVRVVYTVDKMRSYGPADVAQKYGIPGESYATFALLRGDPSDGLPGAAGIGDKTAAALVTRFGTLSAMLDAAAVSDEGFPAGARRKLLAAAEQLRRAEPVVAVACDVPLAGLSLADRWGLSSPLERLLQALEICAA